MSKISNNNKYKDFTLSQLEEVYENGISKGDEALIKRELQQREKMLNEKIESCLNEMKEGLKVAFLNRKKNPIKTLK